MIRSMTGFGKGETKTACGVVIAEARSINHKFLEISSKLPEGLILFEDKIRELSGGYVKRGKVNLNIIHEDGTDAADKITVDYKAAKAYFRQISELKKRIKVDGSIRLDQIITLPGVIKYESKSASAERLWPCIEKAVISALKNLDASRLKEGRAIYTDIMKRVRIIEKANHVVKERSRINVKAYKDRLKKSINEISKDAKAKIDNGRVEQEVALYAKNSDVTEEIIRVSAHLKNLRDTMAKDLEVGKKLDFIAQELNREINTVGSKASDFKISQKVIQMKSEVDKLREQAKNIE